MEVIVKRSTDINSEDFEKLAVLFKEVFGKSRSVEVLHRQYEQNPFGYAWLSMLIDEDRIVGLNSYVPSYYLVNGGERIFANSIDSMVMKPYRDFFNFNDMIRKAYKVMAENGVDFVYGYPNDNSYPVLVKGKLMKSIGRMNIYCLPYRIGGIKRSLRFINPLSELLCRTFSFLSSMFASSKVHTFPIRKESESYNKSRYMRGDGKYGHHDIGFGELHFKIMDYDGIRTAFIIDIDQKSPKSFNKAVRYLLQNYSKEFDLILYPGRLPFVNTGLIKLPQKFEPKNFNLTGKILNKSAIDEAIWNIDNWDTNLSNYDLL